MTIFERISRLLRSNVSDMIDKAEDPEKIVKHAVEELNTNLLEVKTQVASAIATEKQLFSKHKKLQEEADLWQGRAELAVDRGEDDLAREALKRKNTAAQAAASYQTQWEEAKKQVAILKDNLVKLESKVSEMNTRKDLVISRARRASAEERIQATLARTDGNKALSAFDRMEAKIEEKESRAAAFAELGSDSLEDRFAALGAPVVDDELAALKAGRNRLAAGSAEEQKLLGSGEG